MTNREFFIQRHAAEQAAFTNVFKAVPGDKLDHRADPRGRSAQELMGHLIGHEQDLIELVGTSTINHRMQVPFASVEEAIGLLQQAQGELQAKLTATSDAAWDDTKGKFLFDGKVIYELPNRDLGWMLFFDSIHHRGQLSTYLRPMGSKVPSIYGPSADDPGGH